MKIARILLILPLAACLAASAQAARPVKVFILAGQSNMEGQAVSDLDGKDYNGRNLKVNEARPREERGPRR